jgi:hypothetical protein
VFLSPAVLVAFAGSVPSAKAFCERPDLFESEDGKTVLIDFGI